MKRTYIGLPAIFLLLYGCGWNQPHADATGVFEADEVIVSAENAGRILQFDPREGDTLSEGRLVAAIDATNLQLQKEQVEASIAALPEKTQHLAPQLDLLKEQERVLRSQLTTLQREQLRFEKLVKADAATPKQLDDIRAQVDLIEKQIGVNRQQMEVMRSQVNTQNRTVLSEANPLAKRAAQLSDQVQKGQVRNPVQGTVLMTYVHQGEMATPGKPLYKIANLSVLTLRAYLTGVQLSQVKLGQQVQIRVDEGEKKFKTYSGTISWISDKAEFTPKTIQTREERANLVYAVKVLVPNDGYLKIGMYGEVLWSQTKP